MTDDVASLTVRKTPRQARSRHTHDAILEAAARIVQEDGLHRLTTNRIAERAGVSIGSLYQYFPGKEAILATLIRDMRREMLVDIRRGIDAGKTLGLPEAVQMLVEASLGHHVRHPKLTELLEVAEAELPMDAETQALKSNMKGLVVAMLEARDVPNAEQTAFDLIAMCHGIVHASIGAGHDDLVRLSTRLRIAVNGYLNENESFRDK